MKLRNLSMILMMAACGGGGDGDDVMIVPDGPPGGDGPPVGFANSKNDMVYFNPTAEAGILAFTPQDDQPDNQAAALSIADTGGSRIGGEMGIGGDHGDEYFERDTFLITTGATVNEITVRLDWDGATADIDYVLFEEPATGTLAEDMVVAGTGLRIGDDGGEFDTFNVKPSTNYWLWTGVYNVTAAGGAPTLPRAYDLSVYGNSFDVADIGGCTATEGGGGTDAGNDILTLNGEFDPAGATGTAQTTAEAVTSATTNVFCGSIASTHFQASPTAGQPGIVDSDAFTLTVGTETPVLLTLSGVTAADQTALAALTEVDFFILNTAKDTSFGTVTFVNTHGVLTATLAPSVDGQGGDTGPRTIAMVALADAAIAAPINYKLTIAGDDPNTRAPRITSGGTTEANDL